MSARAAEPNPVPGADEVGRQPLAGRDELHLRRDLAAAGVIELPPEDRAFIDDFFRNCDRTIWDAVKLRLEELVKQNKLSQIDLVCENEECNKPYTSPILFEMSNFFG